MTIEEASYTKLPSSKNFYKHSTIYEREVYRRFRAPIDKLYIKGRLYSKLDLGILERFRAPYKKFERGGYYKNPEYSGKFMLPGGQVVFIYSNDFYYEVQLNPSHWFSYEAIIRFLKLLLRESYDDHRVTKLHMFVDLYLPFTEVMKRMKLNRVLLSRTFLKAELIRKGTRVDEIVFSTVFGSSKRKTYNIYDSHQRHKLPNPSTRIERRDNSGSHVQIKHLDEFKDLLTAEVFKKISFYEIIKTDLPLKKRTFREKLAIYESNIEKFGFTKGHQESKRMIANYYYFLKQLRPYLSLLEIDLDGMFHKSLKTFFERKITTEEKVTLDHMENYIRKECEDE